MPQDGKPLGRQKNALVISRIHVTPQTLVYRVQTKLSELLHDHPVIPFSLRFRAFRLLGRKRKRVFHHSMTARLELGEDFNPKSPYPDFMEREGNYHWDRDDACSRYAL